MFWLTKLKNIEFDVNNFNIVKDMKIKSEMIYLIR